MEKVWNTTQGEDPLDYLLERVVDTSWQILGGPARLYSWQNALYVPDFVVLGEAINHSL